MSAVSKHDDGEPGSQDAPTRARVKLTLVLPAGGIPNWLLDLMLALRDTDFIDLSLVALERVESARPSVSRPFERWKRFENRLIRTRSEHRDTESSAGPVERVGHRHELAIVQANAQDLEQRLMTGKPDVVVWLSAEPPPRALTGGIRYGIWTLENALSRGTGHTELVEGQPATCSRLLRYGRDPAGDETLAVAATATDIQSLSRGLSTVRSKDQTLLMTMLRRVAVLREAALAPCGAAERPAAGVDEPGWLGLAVDIARVYARYLRDVLSRALYLEQWQIAYRIGPGRLPDAAMGRLAPAHRGFWADPFVVAWQGRTFIFFEELPQDEPKGRIAAVEVFDDGRTGRPVIVLEKAFHLSYPFLLEHEGSLFMVPEAADSNRIEAYRCERFPDLWVPHAVLLEGVRAFDPTLFEHDGRWWMFVTMDAAGNTCNDELHLFYGATPFGPWVSHPMNPVNLDVRSARPAGQVFEEDGQLIRPAQDCSVRYGYAIRLQRIVELTCSTYREETAGCIEPGWARHSLGTHTANHAAGLTVYDCNIRRFKYGSF